MKTNEYMEQTEQYVLHTYNRFPLVIDHGEGVHLYDTDGKAYLDFAAGIAVYALGYSNDDYKKYNRTGEKLQLIEKGQYKPNS